ncbi:MAG: outer membrane beta-barrel protein [Flavobacterium sp.]|nr:outer membrane beta-barrel protein [Flavobacterium sp.]
MSDKKNIEQFFQDKFENLEVLPDGIVWENIESILKKKEKKRIIPFWSKFAGVAAVVVLGVFIFNNYSDASHLKLINSNQITTDTNSSHENSNTVVSTDLENSNVNTTEKKSVDVQNKIINNSNSAVVTIKTSVKINSTKIIKEQAFKNKINKKTNAVAHTNINSKSLQDKSINEFDNKRQNSIKAKNNVVAKVILSNGKPSKSDDIIINKTNIIAIETKVISRQSKVKSSIVNNVESDFKSISENTNKTVNGFKSDKINISSTENIKTTENLVVQSSNNENLEPKNIKKIDSMKIAIVEPNALEELLHEKEKVSKTESKINRWQVSSNLAPIYFNSVKNGSPLDSKLESNKKNYQTDKSYGLGVNYAINKKIKIRAGLNILSVAYQTNGVVFYQDENAVSKIANLNPNVPGSLLVIESLSNVNTAFNKVGEKSEGILNQKMGYLEVPLELSYKVLDKKFGINIIGGMSTLILNQNEIFLQSTGMNLKIGEANNLSQVHFSGNLGLGFKYGFMKHLEASVEPVFKYQINTFSNDVGNFKPYIFGIYSGISFSF